MGIFWLGTPFSGVVGNGGFWLRNPLFPILGISAPVRGKRIPRLGVNSQGLNCEKEISRSILVRLAFSNFWSFLVNSYPNFSEAEADFISKFKKPIFIGLAEEEPGT